MNYSINKESISIWIKKIIMCILSLFFLGIAAAFNMKTSLGADPITVFYEGLSSCLNCDIGLTINILNFFLIITVFWLNRKYINVGTIIYLITLGPFVNFGIYVYNLCGFSDLFVVRLIVSLIGCVFAFFGISLFIVANIGIDPWTALAIIVSEKINRKFDIVKVIMDVLTLLVGILMGGTFGIITIFCALLGGPAIQKISKILDNMVKNMIKSTYKDQVKE